MTLYPCTETVTISSRGPHNLSNFLFGRQLKKISKFSCFLGVKAAGKKHVLFASRKSCCDPRNSGFLKNRMKKTKVLKPSANRYTYQAKKRVKVFNKAITILVPHCMWVLKEVCHNLLLYASAEKRMQGTRLAAMLSADHQEIIPKTF